MSKSNLQDTRDRIAGIIVSSRHKFGMTQADLAEATGLGIATIKRVEDPRHWPDLKRLLIICDALNIVVKLR